MLLSLIELLAFVLLDGYILFCLCLPRPKFLILVMLWINNLRFPVLWMLFISNSLLPLCRSLLFLGFFLDNFIFFQPTPQEFSTGISSMLYPCTFFKWLLKSVWKEGTAKKLLPQKDWIGSTWIPVSSYSFSNSVFNELIFHLYCWIVTIWTLMMGNLYSDQFDTHLFLLGRRMMLPCIFLMLWLPCWIGTEVEGLLNIFFLLPLLVVWYFLPHLVGWYL